jgi:hypothetical protein
MQDDVTHILGTIAVGNSTLPQRMSCVGTNGERRPVHDSRAD